MDWDIKTVSYCTMAVTGLITVGVSLYYTYKNEISKSNLLKQFYTEQLDLIETGFKKSGIEFLISQNPEN